MADCDELSALRIDSARLIVLLNTPPPGQPGGGFLLGPR
jgi:hypothetical protein